MAISVQNNMSAMNAQRNMGVANGKLSKAMEKLSTGYRINRAADDAAGLAISEKMRAQIKGLNRASKNASDGISLIQTAEGAMSTIHDALGRMETLATQAANGTMTADDKTKAQDEINQLMEEIDRIADTTEFNTMKLLNGDLHDGKGGLSTVSLSSGNLINATKAVFDKSTGKYAALTGTSTSVLDLGKIATAIAVSANGVDLAINTSMGFTVNGASYSIDVATTNGYQALVDAAKAVGSTDGAIAGSKVIEALELCINQALADKSAGFDIKLDVNAKGQLTLNSTDGNTEITFDSGALLVNLGLTAGTKTQAAKAYSETGIEVSKGLTLTINGRTQTVNLAAVSDVIAGSTSATTAFLSQVTDAVKTAITSAMVAQNLVAGKEGFIDVNKIDITIDKDSGKMAIFFAEKQIDIGFSGSFADQFGLVGGVKTVGSKDYPGNGMTLHIGANENQIMNFGIGDMHADAIGLKNLDVTQGALAEKALTTIQSAINRVSDERSKLGAIQNRLDYTITNLDTTAENLQSSESQIRDADMAEEVMKQTQNNVLQQAAQAMLAQANQQPQSVLQLLG